ncbi:MAG: hypothetical protein K9N21_06265 [Deltaproteobacteria bacterium]|nr:hypothetical protein [Deltaproteobacteria bacterium]
MKTADVPPGFEEMLGFGLLEALLGRRSRRFFMGAEIPDGVFAYKSRHTHFPLSELEKLMVVGACSSNTGWHHMIYRAEAYAPHLSNYAGAAGGRTFPSAAGFHTSNIFFTDDEGVYYLDNRDAPAFADPQEDGSLDPGSVLDGLKGRIRKIREGRLSLPPEPPHVEPHNTWVANHPGTLLVTPVGDLAQHVLLNLCYMLQNGLVLFDDINNRRIPGLAQFESIVDVNKTWPITFVEQWSMSELSIEIASSCYAGVLMLQAMGLGGWMFNGLDPFSFIGAGEDPGVPGLGFRYDTDDRWPYPNPTGLEGVMEGFCPPHYSDMRAAVEAVCERKFGPGGPFHPDTPGPWKDSAKVRSSAQVHSEEFKRCVALQARYVLETFGKFPGTVPSIFLIMHLQAHHLDLEFYDQFYRPGAYLRTHRDHMRLWHDR